jgi:hypothetical protein
MISTIMIYRTLDSINTFYGTFATPV